MMPITYLRMFPPCSGMGKKRARPTPCAELYASEQLMAAGAPPSEHGSGSFVHGSGPRCLVQSYELQCRAVTLIGEGCAKVARGTYARIMECGRQVRRAWNCLGIPQSLSWY